MSRVATRHERVDVLVMETVLVKEDMMLLDVLLQKFGCFVRRRFLLNKVPKAGIAWRNLDGVRSRHCV